MAELDLFDRSMNLLLKEVSRSFYLSLAVLPPKIRRPLSITYLAARAADTIVDTRAVPKEARVSLLNGFVEALSKPREIAPFSVRVREELRQGADELPAGEQQLLERIGDCLRAVALLDGADRDRSVQVLATLAHGMHRDLERFAGASMPVVLATLGDLDEHCYYAAGCVGEYWTLTLAAHVPALSTLKRPDRVARGVRLGKALQLVNVLRDAPRDLQDRRCYYPAELLRRHGVTVADLVDPERRRHVQPVLHELVDIALAHVDAAFPYILAIPAREAKLRLAALWPLWIGLETLARFVAAEDPLDPEQPVKIQRTDVYRIMAESTAVVASDTLLKLAHSARRAKVEV